MKRYTSRIWRVLLVLSIATGLLFGAVRTTHANLTGSTFEGGDGNLVVNTAGNTDWANVAGRNGGVDLPSGTSDNSFGQGTKEDNAAVTVVSGSIPNNKSDLTRFYEASESVSGQNFLYLAWERANVLGSANMDFEINQATTANLGDPGAHVINRMAGDLLVTYDFTNGGSTPTLGLLTWVTSGPTSQCFSSSSLPCWGNHQNLTSADSEGAINTVSVTDPIGPNAPRQLAANTFGETAINLTAAGVFPAGTCEAFGSVFLKSRSSASFSAEVKDFVAPIPVNINNCATITIHKVTQNDPGNSSFGYTTTGGLSPATFNLSGGGTQTFKNLQAGTYSVTESAPPAGWTLVSLTCKPATGTGTSQSISGATVSATLAAGGNVDCTYTNHFTNSPSISTTLVPASPVNTGTMVNDTATLSGATANAGGTVTYTAYTDNRCSLNAMDAGTKAVTNGSVADSNAITFNNPGTFYWQAVYSGDANNNSAISPCTSETLIVKTNPTISTTLVPASTVNTGTAVNDTAVLSGATSDAGGTVAYTVYTDSACTAGAQSAGSKAVTNGSVADSNAITFNNPGVFYWQAVYSGDGKNNGATSPCTSEQLIVKTNPTISTLLSQSTANVGDTVNDTASLSGATSDAGGTVTYTVYTDSTCTTAASVTQSAVKTVTNGTVPNSDGVQFNTAGLYFWRAVYSGDGKNNGAMSPCTSEQLIVKTNPTISTLLSPASPVAIGTAVHDTSTLSGATSDAGGTVTYTVYTDASCLVSLQSAGIKTVSNGTVPNSDPVTFNNAGTFYWQAVYSGDGKNNGATSPCLSEQLVVNPNQPSIGTAQNLIPNDKATLSNATSGAGGSITFNLFSPSDASCAGTPALTQTVSVSGNGTYKTTNTAFIADVAGTWKWQVSYTGDSNNQPATSACGVESFSINQ